MARDHYTTGREQFTIYLPRLQQSICGRRQKQHNGNTSDSAVAKSNITTVFMLIEQQIQFNGRNSITGIFTNPILRKPSTLIILQLIQSNGILGNVRAYQTTSIPSKIEFLQKYKSARKITYNSVSVLAIYKAHLVRVRTRQSS